LEKISKLLTTKSGKTSNYLIFRPSTISTIQTSSR